MALPLLLAALPLAVLLLSGCCWLLLMPLLVVLCG
jgi:hypothetical protein